MLATPPVPHQQKAYAPPLTPSSDPALRAVAGESQAEESKDPEAFEILAACPPPQRLRISFVARSKRRWTGVQLTTRAATNDKAGEPPGESHRPRVLQRRVVTSLQSLKSSLTRHGLGWRVFQRPIGVRGNHVR